MMPDIKSFPPVSSTSAKCLILGSMPGKVSLDANQYYAHPRNNFWYIISLIIDIPLNVSYESRCCSLIENGIALWDVLQTCTREGSLDSAIIESSIVPNDFKVFLGLHKSIDKIFFNGAKAENSYRRYVLPYLPEYLARIKIMRLPSTSPANASILLSKKLEQWQAISTLS